MKRSSRYGSIILLLVIWYVIAIQLNNEFRMPNPIDVGMRMMLQLTSPEFFNAVSITLIRSLAGLSIAFLLALLLALLSSYHELAREMLSPIILVTKSIPNISYIILVLIWFGREISAVIITFLILFPTFYSAFLEGLLSIDEKLKKVMHLYKEKTCHEIRMVRLPMLRPFIRGSLLSGIGLAFKVGVMAEILGQVSYGIGRELQYCRTDLDMVGIFAWTGWIIVILIILDWVIGKSFDATDVKK